MLTPENFVLPIVLCVVILFGIGAFILYFLAQRSGQLQDNIEFFLTAKNTQPWYRVAWGFYACSLGAAVMFSVPQFVADPLYGGGWMGLLCYAFFAGFPFLICAYIGINIKERFPEVLSIGSFAKWRFGPVFATWVTINVILNLGIALTAEYTAIGTLFKQLLFVEPWVPILVVALVTMAYTSAGGLYISLLTDQIQGIFIILMLTVMGCFVAFNFRVGQLPAELPPSLALNQIGLASIMTLGVALISSTMFSDAIWQRVWSAKDNRALTIGASVGCIAVMFVTFLFGFGGFIAGWAGLVNADNSNVIFFELLKVGGEVPIVMLLIVALIAATMNEAAVDSFQIALGDTLIVLFNGFGFRLNFWSVRIILVCLNIPFAIIGCLQFKVIGLYLITNLLTTCLMVPFFLGLVRTFDRVLTGSAALFSSLFGLFSIIVYALLFQSATENEGTIDLSKFTLTTFTMAFYNTFYVVYDWPPFMCGLVGSVVGLALWISVAKVYYMKTGKKRETRPFMMKTSASTVAVVHEPSAADNNVTGNIIVVPPRQDSTSTP